MTVRPGRVLTLAGPEVGAEKMRLRLPIRGPRLSSVPGRHAVARWSACGCIFTRGDDRAASRAPPSSPPLSGAHTLRLADERATDALPGRRRLRQRHSSAEGAHGAAGNRVRAIPRGECRPCVLVAARQLEHLEPGAHVAARHLLLAAAPNASERKPISGVQRRRRPDRQACVAHIAPRSRRS